MLSSGTTTSRTWSVQRVTTLGWWISCSGCASIATRGICGERDMPRGINTRVPPLSRQRKKNSPWSPRKSSVSSRFGPARPVTCSRWKDRPLTRWKLSSQKSSMAWWLKSSRFSTRLFRGKRRCTVIGNSRWRGGRWTKRKRRRKSLMMRTNAFNHRRNSAVIVIRVTVRRVVAQPISPSWKTLMGSRSSVLKMAAQRTHLTSCHSWTQEVQQLAIFLYRWKTWLRRVGVGRRVFVWRVWCQKKTSNLHQLN